MKKILVLTWIHVLLNVRAQPIKLSVIENTLHASFVTLTKLSANSNQLELESRLTRSIYNRPSIIQAIKMFDSLNLSYGFSYDQYPSDSKLPFSTMESIERNLIVSQSLQEFERISYGLLPPEDLKKLVTILDTIQPLYKTLVIDTVGEKFRKTVADLQTYISVQQTEQLINQIAKFYGSISTMPSEIKIAMFPSMTKGSFSAKAFLNAAVVEVPPGMSANATLLSVTLHEVFHVLFDAQPLNLKVKIDNWFSQSKYPNAIYAKHLFNEAMATTLGNGYAFKRFTGKLDSTQWYYDNYINAISKAIYTTTARLLENGGTLDEAFVSYYCLEFEKLSAGWLTDINFLLKYRYVVADQEQTAGFFRGVVPFASMTMEAWPTTRDELIRQAKSKLTKVIVIEKDHKRQVEWIYEAYPELKSKRIKIRIDRYTLVELSDGSRLMIYTPKQKKLNELLN